MRRPVGGSERAKVSFRGVNLLDEECDEDVPPSPPKVSPVEGSKHPLQAVHKEIPPSVKDVDREEEKNAPAGGSDDDGGSEGVCFVGH